MIIVRDQVADKDKWQVEELYRDVDHWEKDFALAFSQEDEKKWPHIAQYQGKLHESPETVKQALNAILETKRRLEKLYTYAHLRHDEDIANDANKHRYQQILGILHLFMQETAWFEPELMALPEEIIRSLLSSPLLENFHFYLEKITRLRNHTLTPENEKIIALASQALQASQQAFSAMNDADFTFGEVLDCEGKKRKLTHALYSIYLKDQDRVLRKNTFVHYHSQFRAFENTLAELLQGQVRSHVFHAKARNYSSCLEAALYPNNIDVEVYHALIQTVNNHLDALHAYSSLRKQILQLDELHLYDMYVPLTPDTDITMSYKEAEQNVIACASPLGPEYQNILKKGLQQQGWVDKFENKNKRSGAYSSGCFDSHPYILMNYKEILRDVFTLAHEAGHSMHSFLSQKHQLYHYSGYSIFLAEVASTFNEDLLTTYLINNAANRREKIYLINQKIEDIRATLFRQTMFAEFELMIHQWAEKNIPLTPRLLKDNYLELNRKYFGSDVSVDDEVAIEWARIPHFYYNFYVYQYATGISAALALSEKVQQGGQREREDYLAFLKAGSSRYPLDLLKLAGVDMTAPEPVHLAIGKFRSLVSELEKHLQEENLAVSNRKC